MESIIRLGLLLVLIFSIIFPYSIMYYRGRAGKKLAAIAGGAIGVGTGIVMAAPDFQPRSATVAATVVLTLVAAIVLPWTITLVDRWKAERPRE